MVARITALAVILAGSVLAGTTPLTEDQKIVHVLNRLGYGPRPGDVERVKRMGLDAYLRQQMHPEHIDDSAVERKLADFTALTLTAPEMMKSLHEDQQQQKEAKRQAGTNDVEAAKKKNGGDLRQMMEDGTLSNHVARVGVGQLQNAKITRAVESERQLYEVLVDFWGNHFNIDVRKGPCRVLKIVDERDVIRPNVFGKFRDLLEASAKSPAMLMYLDNAQNTAPREPSAAEERRRARVRQQVPGAVPETTMTNTAPRRLGGINENYAREIMELHTLGVDGGYTQKDVQEVARCLTGWGIDLLTGEFEFHPRLHDNGSKVVLGQTIGPNGGRKDVETVLDILASHPSTAKFIATKLCRRLVSDDPPPALVVRVAAVFRATDGDLRKVYEAIIYSPEFNSAEAYRTKVKSPFEFAVSAVRATGGTITAAGPPPQMLRFATETGATFGRGGGQLGGARRKSLNLHINELGEPLYAYQAPTGYPEDSRKWVNTGALIARMNFALALTERGLIDVSLSPGQLLKGVDIDKPALVVDRLNLVLLQGQLTGPTRATLEKQMQDTVNVAQLTALMLGSPEFQRH